MAFKRVSMVNVRGNYTLSKRQRACSRKIWCFSDVFIQQITCICANDTVNRKKSSVQKQWAALSGLKKTKENCRHASAETSKSFSILGKYLKATIQLTLLLLQTPVTSQCSILACRLVQRRTDRCLDKNIFLYGWQDALWRKEVIQLYSYLPC